MSAYVDGELDRVEIFYNGYISPLTQEVARDAAAAAAGDDPGGGGREDEDDEDGGASTRSSSTSPTPSRSCTG